MKRDYAASAPKLSPQADRTTSMQQFVDVLWESLRDRGVSWIGFYLRDGESELTLGPRRNKPACSPIGLHGVCGRAFLSGEPMVVRDVADLGDQYIACDPRDRSEVVIPLFDDAGECYGVLDVDSHEVGAFDKEDVEGLRMLLLSAKLTTR